MAFRIAFHKEARADLKSIFQWSRNHHPETTQNFVDGLFAYLRRLRAFPYMGPEVRPGSRRRQLVYGPLLVYYRVQADQQLVRILRIRHGARKRD